MSASRVTTFPSGTQYIIPEELLLYFAQSGGEPERDLIEWARRFLRPTGVFVDIGAHIGTYTLSYAPFVRETVAFEPQRNTFHRLCGGIALSGNESIAAHNVALGDQSGERELRVLTSDGGLSSICELPTNTTPSRIEKVELRTLDSYALDDVCLIKIDVEGAELQVLCGAQETLRRSGYPPLLVEVWTDEWFAAEREQIQALLAGLGYIVKPAEGFPHMLVCTHESHADAGPELVPVREEDAEKKKRLLLTMIVKNESRVIERGLSTVLPLVDGYCICDTGSSDNTPALIAALGQRYGVRGTVHRTEWQNYGHNRSESAAFARDWARERGWDLSDTYLVFVDADMQLRLGEAGSFDKQALTAPSYLVLQGAPGNLYPNTRLARADLDWKSLGVTHEYWSAEGGAVNQFLYQGFWLEDGNDGGNRATKFQRDKALLEQGLHDEPTNERYMFYLAQTYFDLGEYEQAAAMYERRYHAGGYEEERKYARMKQGRALLALGDPRGVDILLRAYNEFPERVDPLFYLAVHYREQSQNRLAEYLCTLARAVPPPPATALFPEQDIYDWRLDWEASINGYYTGNRHAGSEATERVARSRRRGIDHEHVARNQMHYVEPLTLIERGTWPVPDKLKLHAYDAKEEIYTRYESSSPTIAQRANGSYVVGIRLVNYEHQNGTWFHSKDPDRVIRSRELITAWHSGLRPERDSISMCELDQGVIEAWPQASVLGLEDQRFVEFEGRVWFTANTWQSPARPRTPQMVLGRLSEDCRTVNLAVPLQWDKAGAIEKNWLPFVHEGKLRIIYGYEPDLVVLDVDTNLPATAPCTEFARYPMPWAAGRFRGSAGPVQYGNHWFLLVHEVTADGNQRIYSQRLMELDQALRPIALSAPFYIDHRGVEFPLGFVSLDSDRALITYGREERESCYAIVSWSELRSRLEP